MEKLEIQPPLRETPTEAPAERLPLEAETTENPQLKFIFAPHTQRHVSRIVPHLQQADIIAYESFSDRITTKRFQRDFNLISQDESANPTLDDFYRPADGYYIHEVAKSLRGTHKQFVHIDAYDSGEFSQKFLRYKNQNEMLVRFLAGYGSPLEAQALYLDMATRLAEITDLRDGVMTENIDKLVADNPDKRIAVVVGCAHTRLARMTHVAQVEKVYINLHPTARALIEFGAQSSLPRYFLFNVQPPESMVQKAILQLLVTHATKRSESETEVYGINHFSEEELSKFTHQLERASKKVGKDPQAEFRYQNAVTQITKLAVKKLAK